MSFHGGPVSALVPMNAVVPTNAVKNLRTDKNQKSNASSQHPLTFSVRSKMTQTLQQKFHHDYGPWNCDTGGHRRTRSQYSRVYAPQIASLEKLQPTPTHIPPWASKICILPGRKTLAAGLNKCGESIGITQLLRC